MNYIIITMASILDNAKLVAIKATLQNSDTGENTEVELKATDQVGVFSNKFWETNGLASIVQDKGFYMKPLQTSVDGSLVGLELHLHNLIAMLEKGADIKSFTDVAKCICINYQVGITPALAYAKDFALDEYTPIKGELCKKCSFKRRCYFYKQTVKEIN